MFIPKKTSLNDIEIKKIYGQSIFELYQQVRKTLQQSGCSSDLLNFFAEPLVNRAKNEVAWQTVYQDAAISLVDMSQLEARDALVKLEKIYQEFQQVREKIAIKVGQGSVIINAMQGMMVTPNLRNSVFLIGQNIVLVEWGCVPFGATPSEYDLIFQKIGVQKFSEQSDREPQVIKEIDQSVGSEVVQEKKQDEVQYTSPPEMEKAKITKSVLDDPLPTREEEKILPKIIWKVPLLGILLLLILLAGLLHLIFPIGTDNLGLQDIKGRLEQINAKLGSITCACGPIERRSQSPTNDISTQNRSDSNVANPDPILDQDVTERLQRETVQERNGISVSLAWNGTEDLDIRVIQPDNSFIDFSRPLSANANGRLDVDANRCEKVETCRFTTKPVENISWSGDMMKGTYRVLVNLYSTNSNGSAQSEVPFTVIVKEGGASKSYVGIFRPSDILCDKLCHSKSFKLVTQFEIK